MGDDIDQSEQLFRPQSNEVESMLWKKWRNDHDLAAREGIVEIYLPYARTVAATIFSKRFNSEIEFEDYFQFALLGMLEAIGRYDPDLGIQFNSFAGARIRGAILTGIEDFSERQQQISVGQRLKAQRLEANKDNAKDKDSDDIGSGSDKIFRRLAQVGLGMALSWLLEDSGMVVDERDHVIEMPFYQGLELKQLQDQIQEIVNLLPKQEAKVIRYHYLQGLPFEEIAGLFGVSKGRISQIHKSALVNLRQLLLRQRQCDLAC
ncbi:sigma-70 family RNA polymerase sigma factor [Undibacterium sp. Ji49W]|uniref:sigma-70 family RNA polymerase sigma factor n=1 Tax=Undibacterium sp. Ji49W TaxID=3413040 RepID=UPI003BF359F6